MVDLSIVMLVYQRVTRTENSGSVGFTHQNMGEINHQRWVQIGVWKDVQKMVVFPTQKKSRGGSEKIVPFWEEHITSTGFWAGFKFLIVSHAMLGFSYRFADTLLGFSYRFADASMDLKRHESDPFWIPYSRASRPCDFEWKNWKWLIGAQANIWLIYC